MDWQTLENVEVGTNRFADGEWRVVEDAMASTIEVKSNGLEKTYTVSPCIHSSGYPEFARMIIRDLNILEPQ